ncbi:MAG: ABC transporter permease [Deltaproteobacteria bacterium]|jgi:putative ABC transport system permease protein|nr:ABC transporter permease [Deltaproteobacteria bacterium]
MKKNTSFMIKMLCCSLVRRRSRMAAALLGIAIGAAVLLGMVTLCYDIPKQMSKEFRSYGANMVLVSSGRESMNLDDAAKAVRHFPEGALVGMTPFRYIPVRHNMLPYTAVGTDFDAVKKTSPYWRVSGEWPAKENEALVGADIAEYARISPGRTLAIDGRNSKHAKFEANITITGIVKTGGVEDGFIFMRLPDMEAMTEEKGLADVAEISCSAGEKELQDIAAVVRTDVPSLEARLVKRVIQSEAAVLGKLEMLLYLVTLVVLVLTMICVATTMMTVIMERRREIGLKKALGAEDRRIAKEFFAEGVILGLVGGLCGAICGLLFAQFVSASVFDRSVAVEFYLIPAAIAVSVLVTVAACLLPVRRAVEIEPALVLRGE